MKCELCKLDPMGKCTFCRMQEEFMKYANGKKLDFGGESFLMGQDVEDSYVAMKQSPVYSLLSKIPEKDLYTMALSYLSNQAIKNYTNYISSGLSDYNFTKDNYKKGYDEKIKNEK